MITLAEVLKGKAIQDQPENVRANLAILLSKINKVRSAYGKPMTVTSGLRTKEDHIRIYKEKAAKEKRVFDETKIPWGSKHLTGGALDIHDPEKELQKWCLANENRLAEIGLWCEHFDDTPNWVHFQIMAPKSGKRFFKP